jgi:hypothetical protein
LGGGLRPLEVLRSVYSYLRVWLFSERNDAGACELFGGGIRHMGSLVLDFNLGCGSLWGVGVCVFVLVVSVCAGVGCMHCGA